MTQSGDNLPNVQTPQTPTLLNNRYRVVKVLGDGGFGTTFLAVDMQMPSHRQCVVKQLKPIDDNPQIYQLVKDRFQREAAILERLGESHEQIPMLYAYIEEVGQFYLVEEWVAGQTLSQLVQKSGPLSEAEVCGILVKLLPVIDYVHQQRIVHRDIKPDNIILRQTDGMPTLIDFGAVKETMSTVVNSQGQTNRSIVVGTPGFMSIEQLAGRPVYGSDLYSLGLTAIYLLTRTIPQELETDPQTGTILWQHLAPDLSPDFAATLSQAIQPQPHERFLNASEMLNRLVGSGTEIVDVAKLGAMTEGRSETIATPEPAEVAKTITSSPPQPPPSPEVQLTPEVQSIPTVTNSPTSAPPTLDPTQAVIPPQQPTQPVVQSTPSKPFPEWQKAVLTGGIIGVCVLLGAVLLRSQVSDLLARDPQPQTEGSSDSESDKTASATPSPSPSPSPGTVSQIKPPSPPPPPVRVALPPNADQANARIVGDPGSKNIRSGPGTNYAQLHIAYPGDRVTIITSERDPGGFLWHNVYFPESQAQGWIASQLVESDQDTSNPIPSIPSVPTPKPAPSNTNATIVGSPESKNIRKGPGTKFSTQYMAYPGDRVQIIGRRRDVGGYLWYQIYSSKSGSRGWIASHLLKTD